MESENIPARMTKMNRATRS